MLKILLLSAPTELLQDYHKYYPLGIIYLASALRNKGHEVIVRDYFYNPREANSGFYKLVDEFNPDIIGFSMLTMNRTASCRMARNIRKSHKEIKLIAGGVHASYLHRQLLEKFDFDVVVIGEAEQTMLELVECFVSGDRLSEVKGIAYKDENNYLHCTPPREYLKNVDVLPIPSHEDFKEKIRFSKEAYIITSRGCPIGCTYCSTSHYWGKLWRSRSAGSVVEEIGYLVKAFPFIENIMFHDDAFTLDRNRTIEICKQILQRGIKIKWNCQTRVDSLNEELALWMKKAGCRHIYIGAESGSQKIIDNIGKKISIQGIKRAAKILEDVSIPYGIYLMVGNPGESEETIDETLRLLDELKPDNFNRPAILQIYPGTEIYRKAKEEGFINDDYWATDKMVPLYTKETNLEQLKIWCNRIALHSRKKRGLFFTLNSIVNFTFSHPLTETADITKQVIKDYFSQKRRLIKN